MTVRYCSRRPPDTELRERLKALAHERRRFGYRRLHVFLRRGGFIVNHKRLFRLYREERLMVRRCQSPILARRLSVPCLSFETKTQKFFRTRRPCYGMHPIGSKGKVRGSSLKGRKVAVKYRVRSGNTWAGRGAQPRWLREKLKAGAKLEDFAVHKTAASRKASPKKRRRAKR